MDEWQEVTDKNTGRTYYYNKATKETRWNKPDQLIDAESAGFDSSRGSRKLAEEADLGDPLKWKRVMDKKSGRAYYYNAETKQTSWKKPMGFDKAHADDDSEISNLSVARPSVRPSVRADDLQASGSVRPSVKGDDLQASGSVRPSVKGNAEDKPEPKGSVRRSIARSTSEDSKDSSSEEPKETADAAESKPDAAEPKGSVRGSKLFSAFQKNSVRGSKMVDEEAKSSTAKGSGFFSALRKSATLRGSKLAADGKSDGSDKEASRDASKTRSSVSEDEEPSKSKTVSSHKKEEHSSKSRDSAKMENAEALEEANAKGSDEDGDENANASDNEEDGNGDASDDQEGGNADASEQQEEEEEEEDEENVEDENQEDSQAEEEEEQVEEDENEEDQEDKDDEFEVEEDEDPDEGNEEGDQEAPQVPANAEEEEEEGYKFRFAKHRKGLLNRVLRLGNIFDEKTLLSFKKSLIKKALLKKNRQYDAEAIQSFKNIMSFMGDRESNKADEGHIRKLLGNGLTAPESLRDEVFLQICKQVTNHPIIEHAIKGWELMYIVMGCLPPSTAMKSFLIEFLKAGQDDENNHPEIRSFAKRTLERLEKILVLGPRLEIPTSFEIEQDSMGSKVPVKVFTMDNVFRTIEADCFTLVKHIKQELYDSLNISHTDPFTLIELNFDNEEKSLDDDSRILDVLSSWQRIAKENKLSETEDHFKIFLKSEIILKTSEKAWVQDDEAFNLLYIQVVHDFLNEKYRPVVRDCANLAALQLQALQGDYNPSAHTVTWLSEHISDVLPKSVLGGEKKDPMIVSDYANKVGNKYSKLHGISAKEAKLGFLDFIQDWAMYGVAYFLVEQKQLKDYPGFIKIGITCEAILIVNPETNAVMDTFGYHEVVTWGHSDEKFILVVGNYLQQRKLFFKTTEGKKMNKLVHDYLKAKVFHS